MEKARDIKRRMQSVDNTKKITRTMEMVAASKLRKARERVEAARPYSRRLAGVIDRLATPELARLKPLLRQPEDVRRAAVVLLTSDRGLCGAFNSNLIREGRSLVEDLDRRGAEVELHVVGKKGIAFFEFRDRELASTRMDTDDQPSVEEARSLVSPLAGRFVDGRLDAVHLVYARFENVMNTPISRRRVLPIEVPEEEGESRLYILDPSAEEILDRILPLYLTNAVFNALLETAAAEQASRRTAMKNATDNAEEMLEELERSYNRARQAEITQQIAEIMGGAEALREE
ncbi:MAG: F0F1 ATP synthase subunit gamma [Gemmatimonadota bacterium]